MDDAIRMTFHGSTELTYVVAPTCAAALAGCGSGLEVRGSRLATAAQRRRWAISASDGLTAYPGRLVRSLTSVSNQTSQSASSIKLRCSSDQRPARFHVPMRTAASWRIRLRAAAAMPRLMRRG